MKSLILKLIKLYKKYISSGLSPACRFQPTCSQYAYTSVERFGALKGSWMALKRLLRCNPLFKGGYDPVPFDEATTLRRD